MVMNKVLEMTIPHNKNAKYFRSNSWQYWRDAAADDMQFPSETQEMDGRNILKSWIGRDILAAGLQVPELHMQINLKID